MKTFKLTNEQLKNTFEAGNIQKFNPGDKFVMTYRNINAEYKNSDIFSITKIEQNTLFFTKNKQRKNRYFVDDSQLITKL